MALTKINHRSISGQVTNAQLPTDMTSNMPAGSVLQTQIGRRNHSQNVNTSSQTAYNASGLSVTITPSSTSNRILLHFDAKTSMNTSSSYAAANFGIYRQIGSGSMSPWKAGSGWDHYLNRGAYASDFYPHLSYTFDDLPNTTSAVTYEIYLLQYGSSTATQNYFNSNLGTIPTSNYSPGMSEVIDTGFFLAQEIKV